MNRKLNITRVIITHYIEIAFEVSDSGAFLHGGRIILIGSVKDL